MKIGAQTWFYWPVTVGVSATVTVFHLFHRASQNGRSAVLSSLGGVTALAMPAAVLATATRARCNDTGQRTFFEPNWIVLTLAVAAWTVALWRVYRFAGELPNEAVRPVLWITLPTLAGFVLEFGLPRFPS